MLKLVNTNRFYLAGTSNRFLHVATIARGLKEYIHFIDRVTGQSYIEEITGGHLEKIRDDNEWNEVAEFLAECGFLDFSKGPMLPDNIWRRDLKNKKVYS